MLRFVGPVFGCFSVRFGEAFRVTALGCRGAGPRLEQQVALRSPLWLGCLRGTVDLRRIVSYIKLSLALPSKSELGK